jgi:hypothetical protein
LRISEGGVENKANIDEIGRDRDFHATLTVHSFHPAMIAMALQTGALAIFTDALSRTFPARLRSGSRFFNID